MNKRWPKIQIHRSSAFDKSQPSKLSDTVGSARCPNSQRARASRVGTRPAQPRCLADCENSAGRAPSAPAHGAHLADGPLFSAARVHREPRTGLLRRKSGVEVSIAERGSHPARADTEASVEALFADCDARRQQLGQQRPQGRPEGKHSRSAPCRSPPPSRRRSSSRRPRRRRGYRR